MLESVHGCDGFNKNRRGRERAGGGYGSHGGFGGLRRLQEEKGVRICCAQLEISMVAAS